MTTAEQTPAQIPTLGPSSYLDSLPERKVSWLEKTLGPEIYRILKGILGNPLSITGIALITLFVLGRCFRAADCACRPTSASPSWCRATASARPQSPRHRVENAPAR